MRKFLITNAYNFYNMGEMLQLKALVKHFPGDKFILAALYSFVDPVLCKSLEIEVVGNLRPPSKFKLMLQALSIIVKVIAWRTTGIPKLSGVLKAYRDCDTIIDLGGDTFSDSPSPVYTLAHCFGLVPAILLNKHYVICSQSIGLFKTPITKRLAKLVLGQASAVTARDPTTRDYLIDRLHISEGKVRLYPDLAYLHPCEAKPIPRLIGINPSQIAYKHMKCSYETFVDFIAGVVRALQPDYRVILIPHVYGPKQGLGAVANPDDRQVIQRVADKVSVEIGEHTDIAKCSVLVGFRMHACVTAITCGIPTIAMTYSHKASGLPRLPWVELIDIRNATPEVLGKRILRQVSKLIEIMPEPNQIGTLKREAQGHIDTINQVQYEVSRRLLGDYQNCRVGAAQDKQLRYRAASAGAATSILIEALESKIASTAITLRTKGIDCVPVRCNSREDVTRNTGSIYSFPDGNLEPMTELSKTENAIIVGLPCQIRALKRRYPNHLYIGLFCSHKVRREGVKLLLEHYHMNGISINYKAKMCNTMGLLADGKLFIPLKRYWNLFFNFCFIPGQCLRCNDLTAERADISVGDAWGFPEANSEGLNAIITRTDRGEQLVRDTMRSNLLTATEISPQDTIGTQRNFLLLKKNLVSPKLRVYKVIRGVANLISEHPRLYPLLHLWLSLMVKPEKQ